jgi:hypothetical protein
MTISLEPSPADRTAGLPPGAALRQRLIDGKGRLLVILATSLVWVLDALLMQRIEANNLAAHHSHPLLGPLERISTVALVAATRSIWLTMVCSPALEPIIRHSSPSRRRSC